MRAAKGRAVEVDQFASSVNATLRMLPAYDCLARPGAQEHTHSPLLSIASYVLRHAVAEYWLIPPSLSDLHTC